jgi:hypothetical protein
VQRSTAAMKHPACAAGRCEVIVLGLGTTETSTDAQNREEGPHLRDVQEASVNDTRCCTLVGNINNTHKHTTGQGVSAKVAVRTA